MDDKLMFISNVNKQNSPSVYKSSWLKAIEQSKEIKILKFIKFFFRFGCETLGTTVINSPMSPPSLNICWAEYLF